MNTIKLTALGVALSSLWLITSCEKKQEEVSSVKGVEHVVIIGVDGLSPDGVIKANTPVMDSLRANGATKEKVRSVLTTASSQNWASMIMGAGPENHGIIDNDWKIDSHSLPPIVQEKDGRFPTIFSRLKAKDPNAEIGVVYHWGDFGRLYQKDAVSYDKRWSTEDSTAADFARYLEEKKPKLAFVHLDHVDHAGHSAGHGSEVYYQSVTKTDSLIQQILTGLRKGGILDKTLVMIVSDHGGKDKGHGGPTPEEGETMLIMAGAGVKKGYTIQQAVNVYDYAATMAFVLGVTPPYEWTGRPVKAGFVGFEEPSNNWK